MGRKTDVTRTIKENYGGWHDSTSALGFNRGDPLGRLRYGELPSGSSGLREEVDIGQACIVFSGYQDNSDDDDLEILEIPNQVIYLIHKYQLHKLVIMILI